MSWTLKRFYRQINKTVCILDPLYHLEPKGVWSSGPQEESEPVDLDQPVFSLVTGKYRHVKRYGGVYPTFYEAKLASDWRELQVKMVKPKPKMARPQWPYGIRTMRWLF